MRLCRWLYFNSS